MTSSINRNTGSDWNLAAADEISMDTASALFGWALYQMHMWHKSKVWESVELMSPFDRSAVLCGRREWAEMSRNQTYYPVES